MRDRLFTVAKFNLTGHHGIAYAELQTRKWTVIDFAINLPIKHVQFVDGLDLMICAEEDKENDEEARNRKIYKMPMQYVKVY